MPVGGEVWLNGSLRNQWPSRCQVCTSLVPATSARTTIGSPTNASRSGVAGSPCARLLNARAGSPRSASGSTRRLSALPAELPRRVRGLSSWMNIASSRKLTVTSAVTRAPVCTSAIGPLSISAPLRGSW